MSIRSHMLMATGAVAAMLALTPAHAQETVKIGLILPMTGGQASTGKQIDNAVKLYMQQNGDTVVRITTFPALLLVFVRTRRWSD